MTYTHLGIETTNSHTQALCTRLKVIPVPEEFALSVNGCKSNTKS